MKAISDRANRQERPGAFTRPAIRKDWWAFFLSGAVPHLAAVLALALGVSPAAASVSKLLQIQTPLEQGGIIAILYPSK
jgi:hypothetical protein